MPALLRGSGLMSTTVLGWALVLLGWLLRRRPLVSFALVALGMAHVLDAPLAMLWGGVFPSRAGVVAVLLTQSEMAWLRIPVILGGGGLMLIVVAVTVTSLFRRVGETLGPLSRTQATLVVSTIATMASLLVGCQYRAAGGLTLVAVALVAVPIAALGVRLVRQRRRDVAPLSLLRWNWALAVSSAWAAAGIVAAVLVLSGLHDGIEFG